MDADELLAGRVSPSTSSSGPTRACSPVAKRHPRLLPDLRRRRVRALRAGSAARCRPSSNERYWARAIDPQLVETAPSFAGVRGGLTLLQSLQAFHAPQTSRVRQRLHPFLLGPW